MLSLKFLHLRTLEFTHFKIELEPNNYFDQSTKTDYKDDHRKKVLEVLLLVTTQEKYYEDKTPKEHAKQSIYETVRFLIFDVYASGVDPFVLRNLTLATICQQFHIS